MAAGPRRLTGIQDRRVHTVWPEAAVRSILNTGRPDFFASVQAACHPITLHRCASPFRRSGRRFLR